MKALAVLACALLLAAVPSGARAADVPGTSCSVYPSDNVWNADISNLPLNPRSAAWLASTGATSGRKLHPDFGGPPYGLPFNVVNNAHATSNYDFLYSDESDPGPYPSGNDLSIEGGSDAHMLAVNSDTCVLYEIGGTDMSTHSGWAGAVFDLSSNALRPNTWTSADAAGLPILPGLVRLDEVQAGAINHAIRFTVQQSDKSYLWPARHQAGAAVNHNLPPMGARFRLKASYDISGFNAPTKVVLTAMKHYGLIVADNGSNWYFQGTEDAGWDNEPYATMISQLKTIPASAFEAVDESYLQVSANSAQASNWSLCTSAGLSPDVSAPRPSGTTINFTAAATGCPSPGYRFLLLAPGGAWTVKRDFGSSGWAWNTAGLASGTYQVGVWAKQSGSPQSYDAFGITTFTIGVSNCISGGMTPDAAPPQPIGATINFTASASGCSSPQYQFWKRAPGGAWTIAQPYGAGNTWQFDTTGKPGGNYQLGVWVKETGSTRSYDSFFISTYALTSSSACLVETVTAGSSSPQAVGSSVMFTANASNCSQQYKFWLLPPGGAWTAKRAYAASNQWTWNTTGYTPGTYQIGAWEGSAATPNSYESFAITSFSIGVTTCTSAGFTAPSPPQLVGASVTFNATSTRCSSPSYEYWLLAPGGAWKLKRAWGSAGWTWNTAGLAPGTYQVGVWARESGSTASYDDFFISAYRLTV
jgi:hypothetical protein